MPTIPLWLGLAAAIPLTWSPLTVYFVITLIVSLFGWTGLAREVRGRFLALRGEDFVTAARLDGSSERRLIFRHILPSLTSHILAVVTLALPTMIVAETALSFLGIGLKAPVVSLGRAAAGRAERPHHRDGAVAADLAGAARWCSPCSPTTSSATACAMQPIPTRAEEGAVDDSDVILEVENLSLDFRLRTDILHAVRDVSLRAAQGPHALPRRRERIGQERHRARRSCASSTRTRRITGGPHPAAQRRRQRDRHRAADRAEPGAAAHPRRPHRADLPGADDARCRRSTPSAARSSRRCGCTASMDKREARAEAIELLRQVEIANAEAMIDRYTFEFSGGMRQRAMIAMALACDPDVLIADEPTTALDVTTQAEILDLIKRLQLSRGMAMLLITHDMGVVAEVADDVAVMRYGRIVEEGAGRRHLPRREASLHAAAPRLDRPAPEERRALTPSARRIEPTVKPVLEVRNLTKVYRRRRAASSAARASRSRPSTTSASTSIPARTSASSARAARARPRSAA